MTWLERYRAGQRWQVWQEFRQLGDRVREPGYLPQARAVCDEMARRARANIETLVDRLASQGYRFHSNDADQTPLAGLIPATDQAADLADWLDAQPFGPLPLTVASWIRLVGDVWLVGTHPDWPDTDQGDPLVIQAEGSHYPGNPMTGYYTGEFERWQESSADEPQAGAFSLPVAPDRLAKANISGGMPYGFQMPDACADGLFRGETTMAFVEYLDHVFVNGGFAAPSSGHWQLKRELVADMLPL